MTWKMLLVIIAIVIVSYAVGWAFGWIARGAIDRRDFAKRLSNNEYEDDADLMDVATNHPNKKVRQWLSELQLHRYIG